MKTRSNMPLFVLEVSDVKALSNSQIDLLRCGDWLVKKDASGEHPYQVTFKKEGVGMCLTYHDASVIETQSYDKVGGNWVYNSEDKTELPVNEGDLVVDDLEVNGDAKVFENIVDKDGHKRFIDGDINILELTGITKTYGKWSLSGSHLLIVLGLSIANATSITAGQEIANFRVPKWVYDKLSILFGTNNVDTDIFVGWASDSTTQNQRVYLRKANDYLYLNLGGLTYTADRNVRIAFDLLIDNE